MAAKLKKREMISREDEYGIVVLKWKDTRDVGMLSTKTSQYLWKSQGVAKDNQVKKRERKTPVWMFPAH